MSIMPLKHIVLMAYQHDCTVWVKQPGLTDNSRSSLALVQVDSLPSPTMLLVQCPPLLLLQTVALREASEQGIVVSSCLVVLL